MCIMTSQDRKTRSANFTDRERLTLNNIMKRYHHIIDCKETDKISRSEKAAAWRKIQEEFNAHHEHRTIENLQYCWGNLKKKAREYQARERRESMATGGGPSNFERDEVCEAVLGVIGREIRPLESPFDSDSAQYQRVEHLLEDSPDIGDNHDVYRALQQNQNVPNWCGWNPGKLRQPVSTPLQDVMNQVSSSSNRPQHTSVPFSRRVITSSSSRNRPETSSSFNSRSDPAGSTTRRSEAPPSFHNRSDPVVSATRRSETPVSSDNGPVPCSRAFGKRLGISESSTTRPYVPTPIRNPLYQDGRSGNDGSVGDTDYTDYTDYGDAENMDPNGPVQYPETLIKENENRPRNTDFDNDINNNSTPNSEMKKYEDEKRNLELEQLRITLKRHQMEMDVLIEEKKLKLEEMKLKMEESKLRVEELKLKKLLMETTVELKMAKLEAMKEGPRDMPSDKSEPSSEDEI